MRVVVQRVRDAEVTVDGISVGRIGRGLVLLVGLAKSDADDIVRWMARKITSLRLFDDDTGTVQRSVVELGAEVLAVSQLTVLADCHKGRRPSYDEAMPSSEAAVLLACFVKALRAEVGTVATGQFGATMRVRLVNDGPRTVIVDAPQPR